LGVTGDARGRCLRRPFSPRMLVARVRSVMRPAEDGSSTGLAGDAQGVTHTLGRLVLDATARRVSAAGGHIAVTDTEFALLAFLVGNAGRVFTRQQLLTAVWGAAATAGTRTVDVYVAQLRAKLGAHSPIRTVRGVGYAADHPS
ncbi:MAG: response regulator transcription factor, partial [Micromonosporaceae bacterium]